MTRLVAINGSPRKNGNTATLLEHACKGASSQGASVTLVHLYDLMYHGCRSCFACKVKGGRSYGRCAVCDDLTPVLSDIRDADALILGSPLYFGTVTGAMRSCTERLLFPYLEYTSPPRSLAPRMIRAAYILTMNVTEEELKTHGYSQHPVLNEQVLGMLLGSAETLYSYDTCQFEDYTRVVNELFDPVRKAEHRDRVFPEDCRKAFDLGARLVGSE